MKKLKGKQVKKIVCGLTDIYGEVKFNCFGFFPSEEEKRKTILKTVKEITKIAEELNELLDKVTDVENPKKIKDTDFKILTNLYGLMFCENDAEMNQVLRYKLTYELEHEGVKEAEALVEILWKTSNKLSTLLEEGLI